jgi:hypothetical protein
VLEGFDDDDAGRCTIPRGENVGEQLPVIRALFDEGEVVRFTEEFPHFAKLRGEQFPEDRADADAGEEVAASSGAAGRRCVVSAVRMIKRDGHEFVEPYRTVLRDAAAEFARGSVRAG